MSDTEVIDGDNLRRHPLWKAWFTENQGLSWGAVVRVEALSTYLQLEPDSTAFAFAVHEIRKAFRRAGKNFTAAGMKGTGYMIAQPDTNADEMERMQASALSALREGVILGTNTPIEMLSQEDARRHEAVCERMAKRLALIGRKAPEIDLQHPKPSKVLEA